MFSVSSLLRRSIFSFQKWLFGFVLPLIVPDPRRSGAVFHSACSRYAGSFSPRVWTSHVPHVYSRSVLGGIDQSSTLPGIASGTCSSLSAHILPPDVDSIVLRVFLIPSNSVSATSIISYGCVCCRSLFLDKLLSLSSSGPKTSKTL